MLVGFIQSVPVEDMTREGGKTVAKAALTLGATEELRRFVSQLAKDGVHLPAPAHRTKLEPVDTPPYSMQTAQMAAQRLLWSLRSGSDQGEDQKREPDELVDAKRQEDGTYTFLYRRRDDGQRVAVEVLTDDIAAYYLVGEEETSTERAPDGQSPPTR